MEIEVAELLFYDDRLSDVERASVEDYLRSKWGVTAMALDAPDPTFDRSPLVMPGINSIARRCDLWRDSRLT